MSARVVQTNTTLSNVVNKKELREVQQWTLHALRNALMHSAGPYGSTTAILKTATGDGSHYTRSTEYTKDGHTILSAIRFNKAIEDALQKELTDITRHIVTKVGDGTTSVIILASFIFDELLTLDEDIYPPYKIINTFQCVVDLIKDEIRKNSRDLSLKDVYDIAMICTNSNTRVATILNNIYKDYGKDVFIDVGASNGEEDVIKTYDGLTLDVGFSDPCYINKVESGNAFDPTNQNEIERVHGTTSIQNPSIYAFTDPIDTQEMHNFFSTIVLTNIMKPYIEYRNTGNAKALEKVVPTVIMAPKISLDMGSTFTNIVAFMHNFDNQLDAKPPLLIITNISEVNYDTYSDIWRLCGCKVIKKYIDPEIQKSDQEKGYAPTVDNVTSFCGHADLVKSDSLKTSFVNPADMFEKNEAGEFVTDDNGERVFANAYVTQLSFLEKELERSIAQGAGIDETGNLKRRIHALKSNMVDYYVGGITVTDRDSVRALTEDAVKNLRSAAKYGVGYGANFEGLRASKTIKEAKYEDPLKKAIARAIYNAYIEVSTVLYNTAVYQNIPDGLTRDEYIQSLIGQSIEEGCPINLVNNEFDKKVLCASEQDIVILDSIAKIITVIFTTNQALTQTVQHNLYMNLDELNI